MASESTILRCPQNPVGSVLDPEHEATIRFGGKGCEATRPFSLRRWSQPSVRVGATSDHRRPFGKIRADAELLV
jgi:hypothetical protein